MHRWLLHRVLVPPRLLSRGGRPRQTHNGTPPLPTALLTTTGGGGAGHGVTRRRARIRPAPPPASSFPAGSCATIRIGRANATDSRPAPPPLAGGAARIPSRASSSSSPRAAVAGVTTGLVRGVGATRRRDARLRSTSTLTSTTSAVDPTSSSLSIVNGMPSHSPATSLPNLVYR